MASSVVLKVIAPPPASGQSAGNGTELPCTSLSSNGPSSSTLDSPLPLEATPLPPSLLSPKLAIALENGMSVCIENVCMEKQQGQPMKMFGDVTEKPAGSPLPILNVLRTPAEVVSARASELLDINQLLQGPLKGVLAEKTVAIAETRASPPSLHAHEMLDDDSDDDEEEECMESGLAPQQLPTPAPTTAALNSDPLQASCSSSLPPSTRSDSASPYADDDSFAMFVAHEANETASALDPDNSSLSPSPTPTALSNDPLASSCSSLEAFINSSGGSSSALVQQFGITAACPPTPMQLNEEAATAPLDMTGHNFPKRSKYAHRAAISAMHPYNRTRGGGGASLAKTLDLLKAVLQPSFNMELKRLCDDYKYIYAMAAANIRENTGDTVPVSTVRLLIMKMIEEAHQGYMNGNWEFPTGKLPANEKVTGTKGSPMATKKNKTEKDTRCGLTKRRKPPSERQNDRSSGWRWGMDRRRLDPVKWDPSKLDLETDFVLGVSVNKALGHSANRGKVYYLHPELFKYACDGDDKTWLYENKYLPVHGGKAFLMIYSEVQNLAQTEDCYKENEEISNDVLKLEHFPVPQFMVDKMKKFMTSVQGYFIQESAQNSQASSSSST